MTTRQRYQPTRPLGNRRGRIKRAEREAEVLYLRALGNSVMIIARHAGLSREHIYRMQVEAKTNEYAVMLATVWLTFPPTP